jgi:cob(I)alamin adenosyltransferase
MKSPKVKEDSYVRARLVQSLEQLAGQVAVVSANAASVLQTVLAQERALQNSKDESLPQDQKEKIQKKIALLKQDLTVMVNFARQAQIDLFDIILAFEKKETKLGDPAIFDPKGVAWIEKFTQKIGGLLPKRDKPVLPDGNLLGVNLYLGKTFAKEAQLVFGSFLGENQDLLKHDSVKLMVAYLEKLEKLLHILSRWANLTLNQREFLWTKPGEKKDQRLKNAPVEGKRLKRRIASS